MGMRVSLAEAARLVGRYPSTVRWHLQAPPHGRGDLPGTKEDGGAWLVDVDYLERVAGWRVDPRRLAELVAAYARTSGH